MSTTVWVEIHGNTFPHREQLRALGGKWDGARKCWLVPADKAEIARTLVPQRACGTKSNHGRGRRGTCEGCGCRINYGRFCGKCEFGR